MYYLVSAAWIVVTVVNWIQGNRKLPVVLAIIGILAQLGIWIVGIGYRGIAILALITVIGMFAVPEIFLRGK